MAKPILLSVDDDSDVLRAIERDLRSQYGAEYRVIGSDSPEGALDLLKQLKVRNDSVACSWLTSACLEWMGSLSYRSKGIYPEAKRALLTAYADTTAAISAINQANINYFFMKPGTRPPSTSIRSWTICSMTGRLPTIRHSRASAFWARAGHHGLMSFAIFSRAAMFLTVD